MKGFLRIAVACYDLLLDVDGVQEILELESGAATHRDWRGRLLACIDAHALLGMDAGDRADTARIGVVYQVMMDDRTPPVILEADRIKRLIYLDDADFLPLPAVPLRVLALFDKVYPDPDSGAQVYRLRRPLQAEVVASTPGVAS
ncbi:MAG: hypothetical protein EPN21_14320 [Methylococcaceae bacterium]|nr:MAG: hypothetical protein EPN21_14320 [Methylococcaceae bacterium]